LRLDAPGDRLQGSITQSGFQVIIPERKVMESGAQIAERDKRIVKVQTKNATSGAQVTFQFRNNVPAYRVRLRKDYVEFLLGKSEDSGDKAHKSESRDVHKPAHKKNAASDGKQKPG
jgi:hypothetical protein